MAVQASLCLPGQREARWPSGTASDSGARSWVFDPDTHLKCVLEQDTFTSESSTGNTQEAVALSRHD